MWATRCGLLWAVYVLTADVVAAVVTGKLVEPHRGALPPCLKLNGDDKGRQPLVSHVTAIQPCPCLDETLRDHEVTIVVQNAQLIGSGKVAETATKTAASWVARIHAAAESARESLATLRWGEVTATRKAIEDEKSKEASVAWRMREVVLTANAKLDATAMTNAAAEWARTEAMNEIVNLTNSTMAELSEEESRAEELRTNATSETQFMLEAAKEMAETANAAESLAWQLQHNDPVSFIKAVEAEDQKAFAQVELSRKLSAKAEKSVEEASVLANSAYLRAEAAEIGAAKAMATAKRNTGRIAVLKARVQKAQQRAVAAAAASGVESSR